MVNLNTFECSNKKIKAKYEFFADSTENISKIIGRTAFHQIENHLSLLEKILYQLTNNSEDYRGKYIFNFRKNELFSSEDIFINSVSGKLIKDLLEEGNIKCKTSLEKIVKDIKGNLLSAYLGELLNIIVDDEISPKNSRGKIEYYSNLIVTELLFNGFDKQDIFHIPNEIISGKGINDNRPSFFRKDSFSKKNDIKSQLFKINEICYNESLNLQYVFRIKNLNIDMEEGFIYQNLRFHSPNSRFLRKITPKNIRDEFLNYKGAFVIQNMKVNSVFKGLDIFLSNVQDALNYINIAHKGSKSHRGAAGIDLGEFHIFNMKSKQGRRTWESLEVDINERKKELREGKGITNLNVAFPKKKGTKRIRKLILLDKVYYKARIESDTVEKIIGYWRYLEALFDWISSSERKSNEIIRYVSQVLILEEQKHRHQTIKLGLLNTMINRAGRVGVDGMKFQSKYLINRRELDFEKFKQIPSVKKHIFLGNEIKKLTNYSKEDIDKSYKYYKSIMLESYEQRNMLIHSGFSLEKSQIKIGLMLEILIQRFRGIVIENLKKKDYSRLSLKTTLKKLSSKGNQILNSRL